MNFTELTREDGQSILVNLNFVVAILPRLSGASVLVIEGDDSNWLDVKDPYSVLKETIDRRQRNA